MTFQYPGLLWALLALLPLFMLWRHVRHRHDRALATFADRLTWKVLNPSVSTHGRRWKAVLIAAALAFSVVAAARPLWGTKERPVRQLGIDMIVALDVSQSMLAADVRPSRLEAAKTKVEQLLGRFPGQRVGLVPFAGDAFLQCPMTSDYGVVRDYLKAIDTRTIGTPGTAIGKAIEVARGAFQRAGLGTRVLILITDGEDLEGGAYGEAEKAAREGILVYTIGIGSTEGAPIMLPGGGYKEDSEGHRVLSRVDADLLAKIAKATGGSAYLASKGEQIDIRPLVADLDALQKTERDEKHLVVREERFQWPLAVALILLFIEGLVGERRRDVRPLEAAP